MTDSSAVQAPGQAPTQAPGPWTMPAAGWKDAVLRAWKEAGQDNVSLIASGVAFCGVLALVPMLGAIVISYGLVASPATVVANVRTLTSVMPADAARLIGEQLANVVQSSGGKKGLGLALALAIALYGAMKGAGAMVTALNIAYDEEETRGFVAVNLLSLGITVGAVLLAILATLAIAAMGHLESLAPGAPGAVLVAGKVLSYVLMAAAGAAAAATLYRYGPARRQARWTWLTPGSIFTTVLWLAVTLGFGAYVANFGSYGATYGSLGAAVVLLTWLYLSAYVLLLGAELNCELERQAAGQARAKAAPPAAPTALDPAEPARPAAPPSVARHYATARATARLQHSAGLEKVGLLPTLLATGGLAMLGRKGRAVPGLALLALGGGLSWLGRRGRG